MKEEKRSAEKYAKEVSNLIEIDSNRLVDIAKDIGKELSRDLKMNQIRRFLDALRKIEQEFYHLSISESGPQRQKIKHSLAMLRPKLAYAVGREKKIIPLMIVLEPAIQAAISNPDKGFEKLLRFMESIIAYHRFYGGSN